VDAREIRQAIEGLPEAERESLRRWLTEQDRQARAAASQTSLKSAVLASVAAVALFLAIDSAVFRSGWYSRFLEPNSAAGQVEYRLGWLRQTPPAPVPEVVVFGDSRIAEGFSPPTAAAAVKGRLHFINWGMPGSVPRVWYYLLRDADPQRNRFSRIVIAFDRYSDEDHDEDPRNWRPDLNFLAGRLRLSDCPDFAQSFTDDGVRQSALAGCLVKGVAYRSDVQAFLTDIPGRLAHAGDWRAHGAEYIEGYGGREQSLAGMTADLADRRIDFPPGATEEQRSSVRRTVLPEAYPQSGAVTTYRKQWLGAMLDLYRNSSTRFVFLQIPRALESVRRNPKLTILPEDLFKDLERPDVFFDGLHLNRAGREIFSARLAERLVD
jgi:hypothetical protein